MPSRNVLQPGYVSGIQQPPHRTTIPNMVSQPSPGFMQQRGSSNFAFGGALGQSQTPQPPTPLQHSSLQQHQQQTNGSSNQLPPHLVQQGRQTPSLAGTAPSASSASETGFDPNDFPALGASTPANNSSSNNNNGGSNATSYASQAGTGVPIGTAGPGGGGATPGTALGNASQPRDFTPDDFPALGQHGQPGSQPSSDTPQPPGLNGFQQGDHSQQHRQNLLGSLGNGVSQTPGMLNLGPAQARNVHPGFQQGQTEAEKQQQQQRLNQATHAAWNSSNTNPGTAAQAFANTPSSTIQSNAQPPHLNAPPGVAPPTGSLGQHGQPPLQPPGTIANAASSANANANANALAPAPYPTNGSDTNALGPNSTHPQTPAQQILMSAADRWGLLGLLAMIKSAPSDVDGGLSGVGTDLGTMGLDMGHSGNLYSTFITPWADQSAAHIVEPDFHLPACYNVQPPPPGPNKAAAFSDETLFFMFYSNPRDALQEVAAQELWNRNWRFHKELRMWITKETGTSPSNKVTGGESGTYTFWDPENWQKERKEMQVHYVDLEEKSVPVFVQGPGLVLAQGPQQTQP
ncbi:hypothetical protein PLICRDRAFT_80682, partial [Plicaturopsis crispa FD-325 SS-3]